MLHNIVHWNLKGFSPESFARLIICTGPHIGSLYKRVKKGEEKNAKKERKKKKKSVSHRNDNPAKM